MSKGEKDKPLDEDKKTNDEVVSGNIDQEADSFKENRPSRFMLSLCYLLAFFLVLAIVFSFSGMFAEIFNSFFKVELDRLQLISCSAIAYLIFILTKKLGDFWRSNEKTEIGTAFTNFPNPFYDPNFVKGNFFLLRKYTQAIKQLEVNKELLFKSKEYGSELTNILQQIESKLRVLLRHNDNANRLLKSYNYLEHTVDEDLERKMLTHILDECITVLEKDLSDKSISLFEVNGDKLIIKESSRINAESIAKRTFTKGEGFAGYIWETRKPEIVNSIDSKDKRFEDGGLTATPIGSIMGFPLIVDDIILGVLCMQSEAAEGFSEADLRTVEFYARLCTNLLMYDKIKSK